MSLYVEHNDSYSIYKPDTDPYLDRKHWPLSEEMLALKLPTSPGDVILDGRIQKDPQYSNAINVYHLGLPPIHIPAPRPKGDRPAWEQRVLDDGGDEAEIEQRRKAPPFMPMPGTFEFAVLSALGKV